MSRIQPLALFEDCFPIPGGTRLDPKASSHGVPCTADATLERPAIVVDREALGTTTTEYKAVLCLCAVIEEPLAPFLQTSDPGEYRLILVLGRSFGEDTNYAGPEIVENAADTRRRWRQSNPPEYAICLIDLGAPLLGGDRKMHGNTDRHRGPILDPMRCQGGLV